MVSTHSRPKAAGMDVSGLKRKEQVSTHSRPKAAGETEEIDILNNFVSTHSRPKAAGRYLSTKDFLIKFQHTAARRRLVSFSIALICVASVSTHSRPKAAGRRSRHGYRAIRFQHTAARRRLVRPKFMVVAMRMFQHTAARRRLAVLRRGICDRYDVSTHSRPKAAGASLKDVIVGLYGFNTQPPEGGWSTVSDVNRTRK